MSGSKAEMYISLVLYIFTVPLLFYSTYKYTQGLSEWYIWILTFILYMLSVGLAYLYKKTNSPNNSDTEDELLFGLCGIAFVMFYIVARKHVSNPETGQYSNKWNYEYTILLTLLPLPLIVSMFK